MDTFRDIVNNMSGNDVQEILMQLSQFSASSTPTGLDAIRAGLERQPAHAAKRHEVQLDEYKSFDLANPLIHLPRTGIRRVDDRLSKTNRRFSGFLSMSKKTVLDTVKATAQGAFYGGLVGFLTTSAFSLFTLISNVWTHKKLPTNVISVIGVMSLFGAVLGATMRGANAMSRSVENVTQTLEENFVQ